MDPEEVLGEQLMDESHAYLLLLFREGQQYKKLMEKIPGMPEKAGGGRGKVSHTTRQVEEERSWLWVNEFKFIKSLTLKCRV